MISMRSWHDPFVQQAWYICTVSVIDSIHASALRNHNNTAPLLRQPCVSATSLDRLPFSGYLSGEDNSNFGILINYGGAIYANI